MSPEWDAIVADEDLSDSVWLKAVMRLSEASSKSNEKQTDRIVEAFKTESAANREAINALKQETHQGLAELRANVNRNTLAMVAVALVGFIALVAVAAGSSLDLNMSTSGITVSTAQAAELEEEGQSPSE
jgi:hypothetical protein